jgi:glucose/mannose-6-phosphate isomerase
VVYTDQAYVQSVARIAKIKFNENSKRPAFFNALPEANHNETIGFRKDLGRFGILYLHDPASHPRVRLRFQVMERVFREQGIANVALREWVMPGQSRLEKIFGALTFADWCSYTLALLDGVDPTPVPLVERFKRALDE